MCKFVRHVIFDIYITDFLLTAIGGYPLLITLLFTNLAVSLINLVHGLYEDTDIIAEDMYKINQIVQLNILVNIPQWFMLCLWIEANHLVFQMLLNA